MKKKPFFARLLDRQLTEAELKEIHAGLSVKRKKESITKRYPSDSEYVSVLDSAEGEKFSL